MKRVVVTGMAGITSLGSDWASIEANFVVGRSGLRRLDEWDRFAELNTRLAGPIDDCVVPAHWTRKQLRSMGRVSRLAVGAAEQALQDAGLLDNPIIRDGRMGVACGSSTGSTDEIMAFGDGQNDASMLAASGLGVAMENAVVECKTAAKLIAPRNTEDGVAQVIEQFLAEGKFTKE